MAYKPIKDNIYMLNKNDITNILALIERTNVQGNEVEGVFQLKQKLVLFSNSLSVKEKPVESPFNGELGEDIISV